MNRERMRRIQDWEEVVFCIRHCHILMEAQDNGVFYLPPHWSQYQYYTAKNFAEDQQQLRYHQPVGWGL